MPLALREVTNMKGVDIDNPPLRSRVRPVVAEKALAFGQAAHMSAQPMAPTGGTESKAC
jgi:hypothetical protein